MAIEPHKHSGLDNLRIEYDDLLDKKEYAKFHLTNAEPQTAANYGVFWIAPFPCTVTKVQEVHRVAGSDGGAVTLDIEKLTAAEAAGAGVSTLSSQINLKATANTVQDGSLHTTLSNRQLLAGDRLAANDTGTLTALEELVVIIELTYS